MRWQPVRRCNANKLERAFHLRLLVAVFAVVPETSTDAVQGDSAARISLSDAMLMVRYGRFIVDDPARWS